MAWTSQLEGDMLYKRPLEYGLMTSQAIIESSSQRQTKKNLRTRKRRNKKEDDVYGNNDVEDRTA
eukprot:4043492-Amphidinium_carterae.1